MVRSLEKWNVQLRSRRLVETGIFDVADNAHHRREIFAAARFDTVPESAFGGPINARERLVYDHHQRSILAIAVVKETALDQVDTHAFEIPASHHLVQLD